MLDEEIRQLLDYVRGWKLSPDRKGLEAAFERLTEIGSPAVPALLDLFANHPKEEFVLWYVAKALEEIGDKQAIPGLLKTLQELGPTVLEGDIAFEVGQTLGKLGPDSIPTLVEMFFGPSEGVYHRACEVLALLGDAALRAVMPYVNTDDRIIRAMPLVESVNDPQALDTMSGLLVHLSPEIRVRATHGLAGIERQARDGRAKKALLVGLRDPEEWVRGYVINAILNLAESGDALEPEYMAVLDDPIADIARIAKQILEKIGTPEALQALAKWRESKAL